MSDLHSRRMTRFKLWSLVGEFQLTETAVGAKTAYIEPGSPLSGHRHAMPCRAVRGRTDTVKASMAGSGTNCSMAKSSSPRGKHRSSSKDGESTTTQSGPTAPWDTDHPYRKQLCQQTTGQSCTNNQIGPIRSGSPAVLSQAPVPDASERAQ